ncbi:hypothetical protein ACQP2U_23935 [Nocardia sp. CA-084685]|uniref:hypothetical protein n=1 Tax=Nocardia sp. CA-084685 TaxID=3239970 RepID=UPI003D96C22E
MNPSSLGMHPAPAPLHPDVLDVLRHTGIGPPGNNQSLDQILAGLGLPPLPDFPPLPQLPGLPPLPPLDPAALMRPITDMLGNFGTGNLGMGPINPVQFFSQVVNGLTQVMALGSTAISALSALQGAGTQAAVAKASQAQGNAGAVTQQAGQIHSLLLSAAAVVQTGNAELAAIATKLAAEIAVAAATPGGQAFIAAATAEAATEAAAVVAQVRAGLSALTSQMTVAGRPVPITPPPNPAPAQLQNAAEQVPQMLEQVAQPVTQLLRQGEKAIEQQVRLRPEYHGSVAEARAHETGTGAIGAVAPMAFASPGGGPVGVARVPLQQVVTETPVGPPTEAVVRASEMDAAAGAELSAEESVATRGGTPMMPMGAAIGARAAETSVPAREYLVSAEHGDEVVGELGDVATPVVGGAASRQADSPDKALTL